jgi:hypothetical protein
MVNMSLMILGLAGGWGHRFNPCRCMSVYSTIKKREKQFMLYMSLLIGLV